jgi:hypothetical protein
VRSNRGLVIEPITANYVYLALKHEPSRREALANVVNHLAGREVSRVTTGEALGYLDLRKIKYRKHLICAGASETHLAPIGGIAAVTYDIGYASTTHDALCRKL